MKTTKTWTNVLAMVTAAGCGAVATAQQTPPPGHAMQFNGANAYVAVADNNLLDFNQSLTLETWARVDVEPTPFCRLLMKGDGINDCSDNAYTFDLSWDRVSAVFIHGCGHSGVEEVAVTPVGSWFHVAVTYDAPSNRIVFYRNGIQVAHATNSGRGIRNSTRRLTIGGDPNYGLMLNGLMDEVRIWNTVRTPAEIAASFNTSVPPDSPGLVAYYTFDEGSGTTVLDRTGNGLNGQVNGGATWVTVGPICPAVTLQPASTTVCPGTPVTLEAAFSGTPAALQWRRNGEPIAGATAATLTIASPTAANAGTYDCVATNACGSATTASATLSVPARQILTPPTDQAVNVDQPVVFVVETDAASPCNGALSFQWQRRDPLVSDANAPNAWITLRDGGGIVGSTDPTLVLLRPAPGLATGFRCKITGGCGCEFATSSIHYTATVNFTIACPADFNADGGVDFGDIEAFFMRWEDGC